MLPFYVEFEFIIMEKVNIKVNCKNEVASNPMNFKLIPTMIDIYNSKSQRQIKIK